MSRGPAALLAMALVACGARQGTHAMPPAATAPMESGTDSGSGTGSGTGSDTGSDTGSGTGSDSGSDSDSVTDAASVAVTAPPPVADSDSVSASAPLDDGLGRGAPIRGDDAPGYVAFTFDDGPHPDWTPRVLAALAAHDVHATFFIVARQVWGLDHPRRRIELAAIAAAGHDIGNHTWSHARLTTVGPAERVRQIDVAGAVIGWVIGRPVTMLRPPYGASGWDVRRMLQSRGLTEVGWSIDPKDWKAATPAALRRTIGAAIERAGGGVVVLHDDKWITATALPGILDDLEQRNCARLAAGRPPILPVSLHYFMHRAIPAAVLARTQAYLDGLTARCAERAAQPAGTGAVARGGLEGGVDNHTAAH